ncbi:phenylacetate-CoA oxygenase subunit PaaJ [Aliifodinibius salipaludis]|uniref:Phenylacetate-CoA oxygenase subunit PaaJ n=1 Tax=Fodinibius salipaludis TaxID=2032627 RepID=A0A2A2GG81_9BACT|nr:1,2-phenylacetyl-CoA epoxidase subunit PaaD [Aliifodinibius salipaludis]PAU95903.1 phenylacetate-CoA oxygenase subunit PaaJ [Aliifodinibius salipaludis]
MATATTYNKDEIWDLLSEVKDPEIPVLSIIELGIAREVTVDENKVTVRITPTYSGCPAMSAIEKEIEKTLRVNGIQNFEVVKDFSETWTTDWMPKEAKKKLKEYGIAPPGKTAKDDDFLKNIKGSSRTISCPYCDSTNTELQSEFGSTACKSQYYCHDCDEPFEHFKCI